MSSLFLTDDDLVRSCAEHFPESLQLPPAGAPEVFVGDALVVETPRPLRSDSSSVASVRAFTDLEVWRTLREQGATPGAAVDSASAAIGRWLEARPRSHR